MLEVGLEPIPGYRLSRHLGNGAFGQVWKAFGPDGQPVALKFLDCRSKSRPFIRSEIRVLEGLRELQHPSIIHFLGVDVCGNYMVLRMELADGNLHDLHQTYLQDFDTHMPRDHALELLGEVAETLDFLANLTLPGFAPVTRGLQHCDIKPSNLLVVGDRIKVADFGLCVSTAGRTHRGGSWRGTPPYAAPELFRGQPSERTDQYALAVTYCELVEGQDVFSNVPVAEGGHSGLPVDPMKLPEQEAWVIARALHPQPATRWPSCREFFYALSEANRLAARAVP